LKTLSVINAQVQHFNETDRTTTTFRGSNGEEQT